MRSIYPYLIFILLFFSCSKEESPDFLFDNLDSKQSGILFSNDLVDTDSFNIMQYLYYYNGGGVAAGDLNNDGLVDLYFTGNQVDDVLYFNDGNLTFTDVSESSGINKSNGWSTGVTMLDINYDGWLDVYVCRLGRYKIYNDHNRLYINNQDGTFTESAKSYGLDFSGFSTQAAFFDYDNDGDLDCYLLNHSVKRPDQFVKADQIRFETDSLAGDRLFEYIDGHYVDKTEVSGIYSSHVGFGLSVSIADLNQDYWPDIYVGNDFHENDYLYLNNHDGTFREVIKESTGHTSNFTMGSAVADINNDGQWDIFSLDMQAESEVIYKQSGGWENKQIYDFKRSYGYHDQSPRNALQIHIGQKNAIPIYSEQASLYDLHATDWSWSPLVADFDLDQDQDIYITNGIYRRPNDMDFVNYYSDPQNGSKSDIKLIEKMPSGLIQNQFYSQDKGAFILNNSSKSTISNGACTADLDNDGDLDIVINNINEKASVLINSTNPNSYLKVKFVGKNTKSLIKNGLSLHVYDDDFNKINTISYSENKGFQSMDESIVIIPKSVEIKKLNIIWSNGMISTVPIDPNDHILLLDDSLITGGEELIDPHNVEKLQTVFVHNENEYNDQNKEPLLLYGLSQNGPKITQSNDGKVFMTQAKGGNGSIIDLISNQTIASINKRSDTQFVDETDVIFFDADGDGDDDLYVCLGGNELPDGDLSLPDLLYLNDGGKYSLNTRMLPKIPKNTATVSAADYDNDGDMDLFVGVQSRAGDYGNPDASYLLENGDNKNYRALMLGIKEMIFDSDWKDIDQDGRQDLIVVGHWMPITILYNREKGFEKYEIPGSEGWWYSVEIDDFDKDGLLDVMAGNFGQNHRLKVSDNAPMKMYINDFDKNGKSDPIVSYSVAGKEYPYANLDLLLKQIPAKKKQFILHSDYAQKTISEIFTPDELKASKIKTTTTMASSVFFQNSYKDWEIQPLPKEIQLAPIWDIAPHQENYVVGGNHFDIDPNLGRQDALPVSMLGFTGRDISIVKDHNLPLIMNEVRSFLSMDSILLIGVNDGPVMRLEMD